VRESYCSEEEHRARWGRQFVVTRGQKKFLQNLAVGERKVAQVNENDGGVRLKHDLSLCRVSSVP